VSAPPWSTLDGRGRVLRSLAWVLFVIPYVLLYGPLAVITVFSFNASEVQALPMAGFTLDWYARLAENHNLLDALQRSLLVGAVTVVVAVVTGTGFALAFDKKRVRPAGPIKALLALPIALPGIILGISLALTFRVVDFDTPLMRLVAGHAVFIMPVVMLIVLARLNGLDPSLEDASNDLGATRGQTLRRIILPLIRTAVMGAALLGFTLSFDEMVISLFLTGAEPTLPIFIWNQLRFGFTPEINAVFALITLVSLVAIAAATRVIGGRRAGPAA
jgi:spermidine/putrescine transport system permease protein